MTRFLKDCLVTLLDFLDSWDSRRIARDQELVRLQRENALLRDLLGRGLDAKQP